MQSGPLQGMRVRTRRGDNSSCGGRRAAGSACSRLHQCLLNRPANWRSPPRRDTCPSSSHGSAEARGTHPSSPYSKCRVPGPGIWAAAIWGNPGLDADPCRPGEPSRAILPMAFSGWKVVRFMVVAGPSRCTSILDSPAVAEHVIEPAVFAGKSESWANLFASAHGLHFYGRDAGSYVGK